MDAKGPGGATVGEEAPAHAIERDGAIALSGERLSLSSVFAAAAGRRRVVLSPLAHERMRASVRVVESALAQGQVAYGVNTGFGRLATVRLPDADLPALQVNLVRSHACGVGAPLSTAETRAMLLLRANTLAAGHSAVRPEVVEHLLAMLDRGIHPVVPGLGSVGASGDLAPLAHVALAAIGEGEVEVDGARVPARDALARAGLTPPVLGPKEGLALLNGTQAMTAVGALALHRALRAVALADLAGALTHAALRGTLRAFDARIHALRPHAGQRAAAAHLRALLHQCPAVARELADPDRVQDAYSLRCMPQVHGAVRDALDHARAVIEVETGSVTDNPLVFTDPAPDIVSGGNFHGAPLALALDYAAIALTHLMGIVERRIERLVNPDLNDGLPAFLSESPGRSSGFMIAHVTAAALVNEARVLAHPASTDNVPTSAGQEDHVSMGMTSAGKLRTIVGHAERMLAIELLAAAQAHGLRERRSSAPELRLALLTIRAISPALTEDRPLSPDIERLAAALGTADFDRWAEPERPEGNDR